MSDAVRVTRLPSGLTVVSETMDRVETVSFGAYVATGTRNETEAENGASHFLEHMAFKGTATRSASDIAIASTTTEAWDEHFLALAQEVGIPLHFTHGVPALDSRPGQTCAALADVLLRGLKAHLAL